MDTKVKHLLNWMTLIAGVAILVICVRTFVISSYRISTPSMENALLKGDYVLVNKLGTKSFLRRNDIFLFKSPLLQDAGNAPLLVSRCIAMPGDTIEVNSQGYQINGVLYPRSPTALSTYTFTGNTQHFLNTLKKLNIPYREMTGNTSSSISLQLTSFEEYQIREELESSMNLSFNHQEINPYVVVVPRKGVSYKLNEGFLIACREAIRLETNDKASFQDGKLYIRGEEAQVFSFSRDYYWALSDNINEAVDSRHLGFIPGDNIIGKVWLCWLSVESHRIFKSIN